MSGQRQKNRPGQGVLAFPVEGRSEAPKTTGKGTETLMAKRQSESLAGTERLMEEVCELENSVQALQRVKANQGSPGVYLCRRLQHLCRQRTSGPASDGERYTLHHEPPQAQGQPGEERRGSTEAKEISRIQLHERTKAKAADRPQGHRPLQGAHSRTDAPDSRHQPNADGQGDRDLSAGLARILRRLSNALGAAKS